MQIMPLLRPLCLGAVALGALAPSLAGFEQFLLRQGGDTRLWRLTNDPAWRDWANYHIRNCWSTDGRYVCSVHYLPYHHWRQSRSEVRVFDLHEKKTVRVGPGMYPRWAHHRNWLFYLRAPGPGEPATGAYRVMWWDLETGKTTWLGATARSLGSTDHQDRWLYASQATLPGSSEAAPGVRLPIGHDAKAQALPLGGQLDANPFHPKLYTRVANTFVAFKPTRHFMDLDGGNVSMASPCLQQCHQSWSGGGAYYLFGNSQMRGRLWNEPFPSNQHYLAVVGCGDICRCGKSDRWICGSGATGPLQVADLRSGDGRVFLNCALSFLHDSTTYKYSGDSALYDNDAKGSPDGTKICFVSNYDLKDGPLARITTRSSKRTGPGLHVDSTDGFPAKGALSVRNEVIGYERKTETAFLGLTRGLYDTAPKWLAKANARTRAARATHPSGLRPGWTVTSFDARLIPEQTRARMEIPPRFRSRKFRDKGSPLMWQRQTDIYVAIVRRPDRPWLRRIQSDVELVPGENHWETRAYRLLRNGKPLGRLVEPGARVALKEPGDYTAAAVEYSGLESEPSAVVTVEAGATLVVRRDKPDDFAWASDRWLVDGEPVGPEKARRTVKAVREIVHRYDGVIRREWHEGGQIARRHDLNADGKAIRRQFYSDGRLARREFHTADGFHRSIELFDAEGFITESFQHRIRGAKRVLQDHWWFIKGMPVKLVTLGRHHTASPKGPGTYVKQGTDWVKAE